MITKQNNLIQCKRIICFPFKIDEYEAILNNVVPKIQQFISNMPLQNNKSL